VDDACSDSWNIRYSYSPDGIETADSHKLLPAGSFCKS